MVHRLADPRPGRERQNAHLDTIHLTHHASSWPGFLSDRRHVQHELFLLECFLVLWRTLTLLSSLRCALFAAFFPPFYHSSISFIRQQSHVYPVLDDTIPKADSSAKIVLSSSDRLARNRCRRETTDRCPGKTPS